MKIGEPQRWVSLQRLHEGLDTTGIALRGAAAIVGFEQEKRQAAFLPQGLRLGTPQVATKVMPKYNTLRLALLQPGLQPIVEALIRPLEHVHASFGASARQKLER